MGRHVVEYSCDEFAAEVTYLEDSVYELAWNDFVANSWTELFGTEEDAIGRLALLIVSVREGRLFKSPPETFADVFNQFITGQLCTVGEEPGYRAVTNDDA